MKKNLLNQTYRPGDREKATAGFTLIETFVAISLLLTAVAGPLTLASKGLSSAIIARDQMIAFYLAQDAIEFVRHRKDSNSLAASPWLTGLDACVGASCIIDSKEDTIAACSGTCAKLRQDEDTGFFTYALGDSETNFTRAVDIESLSASEAIIRATVSWTTVGGYTRTFTVKEHIFDWQ